MFNDFNNDVFMDIYSVVREIEVLENSLAGVPVPEGVSFEFRVLDCLNAYLFYLHGVAISKGLL